MRFLIIVLLLTIFPDDINEISKINRLKREAARAYKEGAYELAVNKYRTLVDSVGVDDDRILLNLSNAYYQQKDTGNAIPYYRQLLDSDQNDIRSIAHQQMGVISNDQQKYDEALTYFKEALKSDPSNGDARYNYELLKKMIQEQQQQNQENQDQQNQDQQNQDNQDQQEQQQQEQQNQDQNQDQNQEEQQDQQQQQEEKQQQEQEQQQGEEQKEEKEDQSGQPKEVEEMQISEEKARMILEAMKNNEIQYLQQNQRKSTQRPDNSKPDW